MTIGKRLREARMSIGRSITQLADQSKVSKTSISAYEHDAIEPSFFKMIQIANALGVSLDWLAGRTEIKQLQRTQIRRW